MVRYLYLDLYLVYNLVVNYVLLWATARFARVSTTAYRLLLAAATGALYALASLFPSWRPFFSLPGKVAFSLLMVAMAFSPVSLRGFSRLVGYFLALAFLLSGALLALAYLPVSSATRAGPTLSRLPWWLVLLAAGTCAAILWLSRDLLRRRPWREMLCIPVEIVFGPDIVQVQALVDTGNHLREPLSQFPVVIVEYSALREVLPEEVRRWFDEGGEELPVKDLWPREPVWSTRFRLIPFASLGKQNGMLIGFRPDVMVINEGGKRILARDVVVGVYNRPLSPEGSYSALLPPEVLKAAG